MATWLRERTCAWQPPKASIGTRILQSRRYSPRSLFSKHRYLSRGRDRSNRRGDADRDETAMLASNQQLLELLMNDPKLSLSSVQGRAGRRGEDPPRLFPGYALLDAREPLASNTRTGSRMRRRGGPKEFRRIWILPIVRSARGSEAAGGNGFSIWGSGLCGPPRVPSRIHRSVPPGTVGHP